MCVHPSVDTKWTAVRQAEMGGEGGKNQLKIMVLCIKPVRELDEQTCPGLTKSSFLALI